MTNKFKNVYGIALPCLFALYNISGNSILLYCGLIMLLGTVLLDAESIFYLYFMWVPNVMMIKFLDTESALLGYFMIIYVARIVLFTPKIKMNRWLLCALIAHGLFVVVSVVVTMNYSVATGYVRLFALIIGLNCALNKEEMKQRKQYSEYINAFIMGCTVNVVLGLVYYMAKGIDIYNGFFSSVRNDRNYFAIMLAFGIALSVAKMWQTRKTTKMDVICVLILISGGILSNSRTFLLLCIPMLLVTVFLLLRLRKQAGFWISLPLLAILIYFFFHNYLSESLSNALQRFYKDDAVGGNGRFELWGYYLKQVFSSILTMSVGVGNSVDFLGFGAADDVEHNTLIQALFSIGILGTSSLVLLYWTVFRKLRKKIANNFVLWMPLIIVLVGYMTINGLYSDLVTAGIILSAMVFSFAVQYDVYRQSEIEE